jgi:hypothetical protein
VWSGTVNGRAPDGGGTSNRSVSPIASSYMGTLIGINVIEGNRNQRQDSTRKKASRYRKAFFTHGNLVNYLKEIS